jgi:hypothetical protein
MESMGKSLCVFGVNVGESIKHVAIGLIGIGLGFFFLIVEPSVFSVVWLPVLGIAGSAFMLGGLWLIGQVIYMWWAHPHITLYENGVRLASRRRTQQWKWTDFAGMKGILVRTSVTGSQTLGTEGKWHFDSEKGELTITALFANASDLCGLLAGQIATNLLPRYTAAWERGETLNFGALTLTRNTLAKGNASLAVEDIRGFKTMNTVLFIESRTSRRSMSINLKKTPNIPILMTIIQQIRHEFPSTSEELAMDARVARRDAFKQKINAALLIFLVLMAVFIIVAGFLSNR